MDFQRDFVHPEKTALDAKEFIEDMEEMGRTGALTSGMGNTAAMLSDTRFAEHFTVWGDRSTHFGAFDCSATLATEQYASEGTATEGCC